MISSFFSGRQRQFEGQGPQPGALQKGAFISKRGWKWAILVTATALGAFYFFRFEVRSRGFDWRVFLSTLGGLDWRWLLLAFLALSATYYGRALRWAVFLKPLKPHPGMWNLFSATVIGFSAMTILGRAGEFVRPYLIAVKERVPFSSQVAAWLLERIYDVLIVLLLFGFALSRVQRSRAAASPALSWMLTVGGRMAAIISLVTLAVLLLIQHYPEKMRSRLLEALQFLPAPYLLRAERLVTAFIQGTESTRSYRSVLLLTAYTLLEWAAIALSNLCILNAFGSTLRFGWIDVLIYMGFVSFGSLVQLPGVGGGAQIVSFLVLTELFRVPLEVATSITILIWTTYIVVVPFGLLLALQEGLSWSKLKAIGREVAP